MHQSKLLVAVSLLLVPQVPGADRKHKQPLTRHATQKFTAFAYTSGGLTSEGKRPIAGKTIAADPNVLPVGSRVKISGAGPWSGEYRVGDVGPSIKGKKVDVFVPTRAEAIEFGRRAVHITVLERPAGRATVAGTGTRTNGTGSGFCSGCARTPAGAGISFERVHPVLQGDDE